MKEHCAENLFPIGEMKHSTNNLFLLAGKTASAIRIRKNRRKLITPNFKNFFHQKKKTPNKSRKFVINRKSVSTSQNEGFL